MISSRLKRLSTLPLLLLAGCHHATFPGYPDGFRQFAYVANSAGNTVTVLDLVYLRADRTLRVGENPSSIAVNAKRPEVYVLNRQAGAPAGSVSVIDTSSNEVVATIPVRRDPVALAVDPSGHRAFVANSAASSISVIDLETRRPLATVATAPGPTSALNSPDGRTVIVTLPQSGVVALFAAGDARQPGQAPLTLRASFPGCPGATSPVILPDSSKAYVACADSNQVLALHLAAAPGSWAAKQDSSLLKDQALALLDVGKKPTNLTLKPDGGEIFVSNNASGSISEISTQTNEVGNTFGIGDHPAHGVVTADNSALWISNSTADSLSLYSIDDGKLLPSVHTGAGPDALAFSVDPTSQPGQRLLLAADRISGDVALIRTNNKSGPMLFTLLPAGASPSAIAIQSSASH